MAKKWTSKDEREKRRELLELYVKKNKTIGEIAKMLHCGESTIYERLVRLGIPSLRSQKPRYNNIRSDIILPKKYSKDLAEFVGVLLGDGHLTPTQVTVTLGKKEKYVEYVACLMRKLFGVEPKIITSKRGDFTVYIGSTTIVRWLMAMGLVFNKVKAQVDVPSWIFSKKDFIKGAIRGLFDTDGSVYQLRFGIQLSFCNRSRPLLHSFRSMLAKLGFHPSMVSSHNVYLTRRGDIQMFFQEIGSNNTKHTKRFSNFSKVPMGASHSGNCS